MWRDPYIQHLTRVTLKNSANLPGLRSVVPINAFKTLQALMILIRV